MSSVNVFSVLTSSKLPHPPSFRGSLIIRCGMSQDYAHACERAELLGLPVPSKEEWEKTQRAEEANCADDADDDAVMQNLEHDNESAQRVSGGLDELNSILHTTQKELNRFKTVCGSLGSMLKVIVRRGSNPNHKSDPKTAEQNKNVEKGDQENEAANTEILSESTDNKAENGNPTTNPIDEVATPKKTDLNEKMGSHLDKLDSLVSKAENAQYSMMHQNKQMKKFLK